MVLQPLLRGAGSEVGPRGRGGGQEVIVLWPFRGQGQLEKDRQMIAYQCHIVQILYIVGYLCIPQHLLVHPVHHIVHYSTYQHTPYLIQLVFMYLSENLDQGVFKNARLQSLQLMKHFLCPKQ